MNKKTKPQISAAMTAAGRLTAHWSLVDRKVNELGGQPEDLYLLGNGEDTDVQALVDATAQKLVARGKAFRTASAPGPSSVPPQMMFKSGLAPKHLFLIHKDGADAPTLISRMAPTNFVSPCAKGMMEQKEFVVGPTETALVGMYTFEQLGVIKWPETDFFCPQGWEHVKQFGLTKCRPDDGPCIRQAHANQEIGEWFRVAHDPIPFEGYSYVLRVGHGHDDGRCLYGWSLDPSRRLPAALLVALRLA